MAKILVSDPIAAEGVKILEQCGEVDVKTGLSKEELISIIGEYDALAVRSETKVTADVIEAAKKLKIIGRAGVGVDNIDVPTATRHGILVVNSPGGNTIAAAELTMALMLAMARNIPAAVVSLKNGEWKRKQFTGVELYKKVLGIIGLGKIGREVGRRALGFEMEVLAYDPFQSAETAARAGIRLVELDELISKSDFITLHLPKNAQTAGMISDDQFARMKDGVRIVNCARGGIIDEMALVRALESGKVAAAAVDVFEQEPPPADHPLLSMKQVVATPHLGASTEEAQINVAIDVAEQIVDVLSGKPARSAVNMPALSLEDLGIVEPYMRLAQAMGTLASCITDGAARSVEITYYGSIAESDVGPVTRAALVGFLQPFCTENVNYVNAPMLAESRGIKVTEAKAGAHEEYQDLMTIRFVTDTEERRLSGTVFGKSDIRITQIDGFGIDVVPQGIVIFSSHVDKPGIIGKFGAVLGKAGINIAGMHLGREERGKQAVMILSVDDPVPPEVVKELASLEGIERLRVVEF